MRFPPIEYYHRYRQRVEEEKVLAARVLKQLHGTFYGPCLLPLAGSLGSVLVKMWAKSSWSRRFAYRFIADYGVKLEDFVEPEGGFKSWNDFFIRELAVKARPVDESSKHLCFPADGRHLCVPHLSDSVVFDVKGRSLNVAALLGSGERARFYESGAAVISRLCPIDYHRFHFPLGGRLLGESVRLPGDLKTVNPWILRHNLPVLWENRRVVVEYEHPLLKRVAVVLVGATNVGSIVLTYRGPQVEKGDEAGYFQFGGSSVVLLFGSSSVCFSQDLLEQSLQGRELYAHMGDTLGHMVT